MAYYKAGSLYFTQNSNVVVDNASGNIANFNTQLCLPLLETKLGFSAKQDLHGYDSPWMDSTALDKKPYLLQPISGTASRYGNYLYDKIIGGTVAFNQLVNPSDMAKKQGITPTFNNGVISLSGTPTTIYSNFLSGHLQMMKGHKYIGIAKIISNPNNLPFRYSINNSFRRISYLDTIFIGVASATATAGFGCNSIDTESDYTGFTLSAILIDLTQMFGSTIADYIYSLEQATAGAGVAFFRNLFPEDYYAYNAGELMSVKTSKHITTGFNQWDEEWEVGGISDTTGENVPSSSSIRSKNYIQVESSTAYYFVTANKIMYLREYDENKNYIGQIQVSSNGAKITSANTKYLRFVMSSSYGTTYNHDICINLYLDGVRDGKYEPYVKHEYTLDSDLELRGIPKLDANNNLYYDGDIYESSGKVTRNKYITRITGNETGFAKGNTREHTFILYSSAFPVGSRPINNLWVRNTTYLFGWKDLDVAEIDTVDGVYIRNTAMLILTITSCSTEEEARTYLASHPLFIGWDITPTTETADAFTNPQVSDQYGTEEYLDSRTIPIPVGHETYQANICPIEGVSEVNYAHSGKNFLNPNYFSGYPTTYEVNSDGSVTVKDVDGRGWIYLNEMPMKKGTYIFSKTIQKGTIQVRTSLDNYASNLISSSALSQSFTLLDDCFIKIKLDVGAKGEYPITDTFQIEKGSDATSIVPYTGSTALIQLGDTYYGGEVIIDKNGKRKISLNKKLVTIDGSQTIIVESSDYIKSDACDGFIFANDIYPVSSPRSQADGFAMCDKLQPLKQEVWFKVGVPNTMTLNSIQIHFNIANGLLGVIDPSQETQATVVEKLKAYLQNNPITVMYGIEPILIDLPDGAVIKSIPAVNNIFCDTGDTAVKFRKIGE